MMGKISCVLEQTEAEYQQLVGDPHYNSWQRSHYNVGKVMAMIKEQQDEDPETDIFWRIQNYTILEPHLQTEVCHRRA